MRSRSIVTVAAVIAAAVPAALPPVASVASRRASLRHEVITPAPSAPLETALLSTRRGLKAVAVETGDVEWNAHDAVLAPDQEALVATTSKAGTTRLIVRETSSGDKLARVEIPGKRHADVVSGSGRLVALTQPRGRGATPWLPDGRRRTKLVVTATDGSRPRRFDLRGNFEPEAFSTDDETLFMIEYMPALQPSHYSVRRLNLRTGRVLPIARLKQAAPGVMRGTGRMQVLAPDRDELYTLYTQQGPNYAHGEPQEHSEDTTHAFVHVLNLRYRWAHCVDLPMPFGMGHATASAIAISPEGDRLYVSDWTNGAVAVIKPDELTVVRLRKMQLGAADDATFAQVGADGTLYVAGNSEVVAIDGRTLKIARRWSMPSEVSGLAVGSDGRTLYVGLEGELARVDIPTGAVLGRWPVGPFRGLIAVRPARY